MSKIAKKKAWVCKKCPITPNAETIEAMMECDRGEGITVGSIEELFAYLNDDFYDDKHTHSATVSP